MARIAIYTRVSTDRQKHDTQLRELRAWAKWAGHKITEVYSDAGISGSKGRDKRPAFDAMLKAAVRREFDMLAVWSSDRLGRSLQHLVDVLQTIRDTGIGLYIHTQALDTTTPAGRAMFGMLAVFGEFEREMIVARVNAGLARAKGQGKRLGRPGADGKTLDLAREALKQGTGILKVARRYGLGTGTVGKLKASLG